MNVTRELGDIQIGREVQLWKFKMNIAATPDWQVIKESDVNSQWVTLTDHSTLSLTGI